MYSGAVSDYYKSAIKKDVRTVRMVCKIDCSDKTTYKITDKDILRGSLYVNSRCVSKDDIELGCLYASELGLSIKYKDNPYIYKDATISPVFGLYIDELGDYEDVNLGVFEVSDISRNGDYVRIIAIDKMLYFDKTIPTSQLSVQSDGSYGFNRQLNYIIIWCCEQCGVPTKLTLDHFTSEDFPNAEEWFEFKAEPKNIPSYRDVLTSVLQLLGLFGYINENGYFSVGRFCADPSYEISPRDRFSLSYSDYEVRNAGFSFQGILSGGGYYSIPFDDNIFLQEFEWSAENTIKIAKTLKGAYTGSLIETMSYVPCSISYPGDPSIFLGQMITVIVRRVSVAQYTCAELTKFTVDEIEKMDLLCGEGYYIEDFNTVVMQHNWVYRGECKIYSYGKNKNLRKIYK